LAELSKNIRQVSSFEF